MKNDHPPAPAYRLRPQAAFPHGTRYPWDKWFARRSVCLVRGKNYQCRTASMVQHIYQAARKGRYNLEIDVHPSEDERSITIVVFGPKRKGAARA